MAACAKLKQAKNVTLHVLNSSGRLKPYVNRIVRVATDTVTPISEAVVLSDLDIVVVDQPKATIAGMGISGYSPGPHLAYVYLDPSFRNFANIIANQLGRTIAHELHHCIRSRGPGYGETLLEAMVSEGLADHFDLQIWRKHPNPWDTALTRRQLTRFLARAKRIWHKRPYKQDKWFYGDARVAFPRWVGYSIGFWLVQRYLENHPRETAASLLNAPAQQIAG